MPGRRPPAVRATPAVAESKRSHGIVEETDLNAFLGLANQQVEKLMADGVILKDERQQMNVVPSARNGGHHRVVSRLALMVKFEPVAERERIGARPRSHLVQLVIKLHGPVGLGLRRFAGRAPPLSATSALRRGFVSAVCAAVCGAGAAPRAGSPAGKKRLRRKTVKTR